MCIAGKVLDNTIRPALSVLLATLHLPPPKSSRKPVFHYSAYPYQWLIHSKDTHMLRGRGGVFVIDGGRKMVLKVPKCENFHRTDFFDFFTIKPLWVGNFRAKIKNSKF
jgi:hypothetical protein